MKQRLFIFLALIFLVVLLVGLNAASYVQKAETPDSEFYPNRSTYNPGSTGTRAFYELLAATGSQPVRWQEETAELLRNSKDTPQTFVIIGELRHDYTDAEIEQLLRWVSQGGKLVVIDRSPPQELISTTANWKISPLKWGAPTFGVDPADQQQMTNNTVAAKPVQPTIFTRNVNAVQPSRFASSILLESFPADAVKTINTVSPSPTPVYGEEDYDYEEPPPPAAKPLPSIVEDEGGEGAAGEAANKNESFPVIETNPESSSTQNIETIAQTAPVVHVANKDRILLADFPYGSGQIVFLTDPYIVSNAGISLVDNAQLALNVAASREGVIAFDEYHQGFGANENRLLAYFAGTPIPGILAQLALLIAVVLFTQSRRFARPLPAAEPSRLSKLEYVSAMAELQQRTRAFDLAVENIYADFRRRVTKSFGVDNLLVERKELAIMVAERAKFNADETDKLMFKCEEIIRGEPTNKREVLQITSRLREIEEKLGLKRSRKQAFGK